MGPYRDPFWHFGSLLGLYLFFQGSFFQCFGLIHAKNVNLICMYTTMSYLDLTVMSNDLSRYLQALGLVYTVRKFWFLPMLHALNFINRRFGSLFWLLGVPIGSLFHKLDPYWSLHQSLGVPIIFCHSAFRDPGPKISIFSVFGSPFSQFQAQDNMWGLMMKAVRRLDKSESGQMIKWC